MTERLVERRPAATADELAARFEPPRRFAGVSFDNYVPDPAHPSQVAAKAALQGFADVLRAGVAPAAAGGVRARWGRRPAPAPRPADAAARIGRYLDGGFGVGKTHLLASLWHAVPGPKAYLTFEELTAFIGFVGMAPAVRAFAGHRLVCIDEFELDDVANTRMAASFLKAVIDGGTRLAATSNAVPDRLGEGRFNGGDFERELLDIGSHWDVVRISGPDYRATARPSRTESLTSREVDAVTAGRGRVSVDDFDELMAHLRLVHPIQYRPLIDGLEAVVVEGLHRIENQGSALLLVQLVDEIYDAAVTFAATGCDITELFDPSYRHGSYRKKYGRCESRLGAMLGEL